MISTYFLVFHVEDDLGSDHLHIKCMRQCFGDLFIHFLYDCLICSFFSGLYLLTTNMFYVLGVGDMLFGKNGKTIYLFFISGKLITFSGRS